MKNPWRWIRRYMIWMGASYILCVVLFEICVFRPQRRRFCAVKAYNRALEGTYLMTKSSEGLLDSLAVGVSTVRARVRDLAWLAYAEDPTHALFQHAGAIAENRRLKLISLQRLEGREKEWNQTGHTSYFFWNLQFQGQFPDVVQFMNDLERSPRYIRIEQIEIVPDEEGQSVFSLTVVGVKQRGGA